MVLDGVVGPWFIDRFRTAALVTGVPLHYVVLRPDRRTVLARATGRGADALTGPGPVLTMYDQFTDLGIYERHVLDTSALDPHSTVEAVRECLASGVLLTSPATD